jgi:exonuclease SbcC
MKILALRFKNLNSLYGEWLLDFSTPEFTANGIFAITGPTGAGKSTILDAICLALYGATPRLGKITATTNEIMSRQTGECLAEVTFESTSGRFRCCWSQHRARKKPDGRLAAPQHEIVDTASSQVLATKIKEVAQAVVHHTGMDFDRFTRSILLAQGGFAAFLQAKPDERAPVLEQITGTEIYSEISKRVHERHRQERQKLELLQAETAGIELLSDEQAAELSQNIAEQEKAERGLSKRHAQVAEAIRWLSGIETLRAELAAGAKETVAAAESAALFLGKRKKLARGLKAAELEPAFATLTARRRQQKEDQDSLEKDEQELPRITQLLEKREKACIEAAAAVLKAREDQKNEQVLIKEVRALDLQISEKTKLITGVQAELGKEEHKLAREEQRWQKARNEGKDRQRELEKKKRYLADHACDEQLITKLAGITEQLTALQTAAREIFLQRQAVAAQEKQLKKANKEYATFSAAFAAQQEKHAALVDDLSAAQQQLKDYLDGRLLREYRDKRDSLLQEMVYLQRISSLEADRKKLADGSPCPLCGATEHPYAEGNIPQIDATEQQIEQLATLIQAAEKMEQKLQALESREKKQAIELASADKLLLRAGHGQQQAEKDLQRLTEEVTAAEKQFGEKKYAALAGLEPFAVGTLPESDIDTVLQGLTARRDQWQRYRDSEEKIKEQQQEIQRIIERQDVVLENLKTSVKKKQDLLADHNKELQQLSSARRDIYGDKLPDAEEKRLEKHLAAAESAEKTARQSRDMFREQVTAVTSRIKTLNTNLAEREKELAVLTDDFAACCLNTGFEDEQSFCSSRLLPEERDRLQQRARELDELQASLAARTEDRTNRLALELEKKVTTESLEDLRAADAELRAELKKTGEEIGAVKQRLADNSAALKKIKDKQALIEAAGKECDRWNRLHALIGSADGKKYRNFAQGITFELMVSHANLQLAQMTDRYLLIRDEKQPLELNVIDNYQAGEIRSTKNLSGGESFIVSLSLALGLSRMAGRKVRVDSLFLDEGFGTLDDEALETALETLAGLQQDGKLIGIISHVSALKERISTRITIVSESGGKSTVSGAGCGKIVSGNG